MKGLLMKDLLLLKNQMRYLLMIFLIGIIFCFNNVTVTGGISYIIFASTFSTISIFAYDEVDNCMMFLMTLPSGREKYIQSKFLIGLITPLVISIILLGAGSAFEMLRSAGSSVIHELIITTLIMLFVAWIMFSVYFPIQLKFGSDKVRVVILILVGAIVGGSFVISETPVGDRLFNYFDNLSGMSEWMLTGIFFLTSIITNFISFTLTQKIIKEKEF